MTISKLAQLNKANGGHFFDQKSMKAFGETQKSFKSEEGVANTTLVTRIKDGKRWAFDNTNGRVIW